MKHKASLPYHQFMDEDKQQLDLLEADRNRIYQRPPGLDSIYEHAHFNVKMRWIEQGIWKDEWNAQFRPGGHWKHEQPLKPESEMASGSMPPMGLFGPEIHWAKQPAKSDEELQREQRERQASRPYYQFIYQVSKERERIQEEMNPPKPPRQNPMTQACVGLDRFHAACRGSMNNRSKRCSERSWEMIRVWRWQAGLMAIGLQPQNNPEKGYSGLPMEEEYSGLLIDSSTRRGARHMMQRRPTATGLGSRIHGRTCSGLTNMANQAGGRGLAAWTTR
jgi:hypothetical protein